MEPVGIHIYIAGYTEALSSVECSPSPIVPYLLTKAGLPAHLLPPQSRARLDLISQDLPH